MKTLLPQCVLTNQGEPDWCPMHAHWTKSLVPCGLCDSDEPFSFVDRVQHATVCFVATTEENELVGYKNLYLTFWSANRKTDHLYPLLSLCKLNDQYLHCNSKCSCYLSLQFDLLTEEQPLSPFRREVPSCSLLHCGMISPSRNHCTQSMLMILSTAVFHFLQYKLILFHFVCLLFHYLHI